MPKILPLEEGDREAVEGAARRYPDASRALSLVDRETGRARSFVVDNFKAETLVPNLKASISKEARLMTDEAHHYLSAAPSPATAR